MPSPSMVLLLALRISTGRGRYRSRTSGVGLVPPPPLGRMERGAPRGITPQPLAAFGGESGRDASGSLGVTGPDQVGRGDSHSRSLPGPPSRHTLAALGVIASAQMAPSFNGVTGARPIPEPDPGTGLHGGLRKAEDTGAAMPPGAPPNSFKTCPDPRLRRLPQLEELPRRGRGGFRTDDTSLPPVTLVPDSEYMVFAWRREGMEPADTMLSDLEYRCCPLDPPGGRGVTLPEEERDLLLVL
mmetsp:Transcript_24291/g.49203  ORF Transcript_24291/g.49203 Transcript_24291/m.49203 type:complete len:242 (-) Transcript_24291:61-786(-)